MFQLNELDDRLRPSYMHVLENTTALGNAKARGICATIVSKPSHLGANVEYGSKVRTPLATQHLMCPEQRTRFFHIPVTSSSPQISSFATATATVKSIVGISHMETP